MVRRPREKRLGILPDYPERLCAHHVAPRVSNGLPVQAVIERLTEATVGAFHAFWPDNISLLDPNVADAGRIHGPRQLTDLYLLALAIHHGGYFVTFDALISPEAIRGADKKHLLKL